MRRTHASILPLHGISTSALLTPSFRISLGFKHTMNSILYIHKLYNSIICIFLLLCPIIALEIEIENTYYQLEQLLQYDVVILNYHHICILARVRVRQYAYCSTNRVREKKTCNLFFHYYLCLVCIRARSIHRGYNCMHTTSSYSYYARSSIMHTSQLLSSSSTVCIL